MATEPSNDDTVRRNASNSSTAGGVAGDERRDHLGVGGDRTGDAQAVLDAQVGVVVDVAVERADDERRVRPPPGCSISSLLTGWALGSEMMPTLAQRVWPSTATWARRRAQGEAQQLVGGDRGAHRPGVVAELADLGRRLVDERQRTVRRSGPRPIWNSGSPARSASAATIAGSSRSRSWSRTKTWMPAESRPRTSSRSMRRERLLDREVARRARRAGVAPGEGGDRGGGAQAVAADGPQRVAQRDQLGAAPLERVDVEVAGGQRRRRPRRRTASSWSRRAVIAGDQLGVVDEGEQRPARRGASASTVAAATAVTAATSPRAASRGVEAGAAPRRGVGTGRVGGRLTMPMIPHIALQATDRADRRSSPRQAVGRSRTACGDAARRPRRPGPASGASTITRTSGSVPLGRTSTRPRSPSVGLDGGDLGGEQRRRRRASAQRPAR